MIGDAPNKVEEEQSNVSPGPAMLSTAEEIGIAAPGPSGGDPQAKSPAARSQARLVLRRFLRHRVAVTALLGLVTLFVLAMLAKQVARYPLNPNPLPLLQANHGPSAAHWFGTDELGRDQVTRVLYACRLSLTIGLLVAILSTLIGTLVGATAGYFGG